MRAGNHCCSGFQETGFCRCDFVVDRNNQALIDHQVIGKCFVGAIVAIRAGAAFAFFVGAVAGQALAAVITHAAVIIHSAYLLADCEVIEHFVALGDDGAGPFVAGSHREALMVTQAHPLLIVRSTDVVGSHFDDDIRRAHFGERHFVHLSYMSFDDYAKMNFVGKHLNSSLIIMREKTSLL